MLEGFEISENYPNPFNPITHFSLNLPQRAEVILEVFNVTGKLIDREEYFNLPAGNSVIYWNARLFPSGVYFYKIFLGSSNLNLKSGRMTLVK